MSRIGEMEFRTTDDGRQYFVGTLGVKGYRGRFYLIPNSRKGENAPDWVVREPRVSGSDFQPDMGIAREKEGRENGTRYLDLYFNGPSFDKPLGNVKAFKRDDADDGAREMWDVIYSRPGSGKGSGSNGGGQSSGTGDDEIPF